MQKYFKYWVVFNALIWLVATFTWNEHIALNIDIWYLLIGYPIIVLVLSVLSTLWLLFFFLKGLKTRFFSGK